MIGSSKTLSISYGAFACKLEGFDDPIETLRVVTEYFEELSQRNPSFGTVELTPGADLARHVAQSQELEKVEVTCDQGHVHIQAQESQTAGDALAQDQDNAVMSSLMASAGLAAAGLASDVGHVFDAVSADPAPELDAPITQDDLGILDSNIQFDSELPEILEDAVEDDKAAEEAVEEHFEAVEEVQAPDISAPEVTPAVAEPAPLDVHSIIPEVDMVECTPSSVAAEVVPETPEETGSEDEAVEPLSTEDPADTETAATNDTPEAVIAAAEATFSKPSARFDDLNKSECDAKAESMSSTAPSADPASSTDDWGAIASALANTTPHTNAKAPSKVIRVEATPQVAAASEPANDIVGLAALDGLSDDEVDLDSLFDEPAVAEDNEAQAPLRLTDAVTEPTPSADTEPLAEPAAELETVAKPEPISAPEPEPAITQLEETVLRLETAPARPEPEPIVAEEPAPKVIDHAAIARRNERRATLERSGTEADVKRLLSQADVEMKEPDTSRRQKAIAHLKAAVAATETSRDEMSNPNSEPPGEAAYREDLSDIVSRSAPQNEARPKTRPLTKPLLDLKDEVSSSLLRFVQSEQPTTPPPAQPIAQAPAGTGGSLPQLFSEYCAEVEAKDVSARVEAAAAFLIDVDEQEYLTRPWIIALVRDAAPDEFDREGALRSFGALVRERRLEDMGQRRFIITERTRYRRPGKASA